MWVDFRLSTLDFRFMFPLMDDIERERVLQRMGTRLTELRRYL